MSDMIKDGTGKGYLAAVNKDNQLLVRATAVEQRLESSVDGNYYEATTEVITITDAAETNMIYIKNTDTDPNNRIVIDRVFIDIWATTGGTGNGNITYYKNPTITGGTDIVPVNSNFGDGTDMVGTFKKSTTTMTEGTAGVHFWHGSMGVGSNVVDEERIVIPPGYSIGISYTAPASNTSQKIAINVAMFDIDVSLLGGQ